MTLGQDPDVIVIGAGVSGLAAACVLAESRRVVVLEQHAVAGGLLQRFRRRGIPFDTGFHYFGGAGESGPFRPLLARLGVLDRISLEPLDPDGFDEIVLPGRRVALPQGIERIAAHLAHEFPDDAAGLRAWLDEVAAWADVHGRGAARPAAEPDRTVVRALDERIRSPDLKAILAAHGFLFGVPAVRAPVEAHAVVCASYYHSAHGVRGGGDALTAAFLDRLRELGGTLRLRTGVRRVLAPQRTVCGVETDAGEVIRAPLVVATAHPSVTLDLLRDADVPERHRRLVRAFEDTPGALLIHGVVRGAAPPERRRNRLWFERPEDAWNELRPWFAAEGTPPRLAVLPGPATPEAAGATVFQVLCPMSAAELPATADAAEWNARKLAAARRIVPIVEQCEPAWAGRIDVIDVSTPRSLERFVRSPGGSCFGVATVVGQARAPKFPPSFGLRGLVVAGQSRSLPGVYGAVASAVAAADASQPRASA